MRRPPDHKIAAPEVAAHPVRPPGDIGHARAGGEGDINEHSRRCSGTSSGAGHFTTRISVAYHSLVVPAFDSRNALT